MSTLSPTRRKSLSSNNLTMWSSMSAMSHMRTQCQHPDINKMPMSTHHTWRSYKYLGLNAIGPYVNL
jgi:hypothetical protein